MAISSQSLLDRQYYQKILAAHCQWLRHNYESYRLLALNQRGSAMPKALRSSTLSL
ncbi:MAG: hypothetical protein IM493_04830 [Microcystis sp. M080S2]|nr:hypothetical protein [Microcystis sp. M080S2]